MDRFRVRLLQHLRRICQTSFGQQGQSVWQKQVFRCATTAGLLLSSGYVALECAQRWNLVKIPIPLYCLSAEQARSEDDASLNKRPLTSREQRFLKFASVEFNSKIYMTPRDFLDSVTQEMPKHRISRRMLMPDEVDQMLKKTVGHRKGSGKFFRELDVKGIISYTEYLFLLSVLTKPKTGFSIAFNMFDMDGNQQVDKREFLVIQGLVNLLRRDGKIAKLDENYSETPRRTDASLQLENLVAQSRQTRLKMADEGDEQTEDQDMWHKSSAMVDEKDVQDTTLLRHFFGRRGTDVVSFEDFQKFYDNLQSEVLEIEFNEFSKGKASIAELDFAKMLLRYTVVHMDDYENYLRQVRERIPEEKGITFEQFRNFCQFLNNLDDFTIAVKLYTFADLPVSQEEFARAVKISTGYALDAHVVNTVFQIFDVNNDGSLSYDEFIAVMKDRIHRGFRSHLMGHATGWSAFKSCVREQMKSY